MNAIESPTAGTQTQNPSPLVSSLREECHDAAMHVIEKQEAWERRHREFGEWAATVRDPAKRVTEGIRTIGSRKMKAEASYQIAPLPDGRWALRYDLSYWSGDCHGRGTPWDAYPTREACVAAFLEDARRHFGLPVGGSRGESEDDVRDGYRAQREARKKMLALLEGDGLFGFVEPEPVPVEPDKDDE